MKSLDIYSKIPSEMMAYIDQYGFHFNKKACDFAISLMTKKNASTGKKEHIDAWNKSEVDDLLKRNSISLEHNKLYDYVYVANKAQACMLKSSLEDEKHVALYVKDVIDNASGSDENVFRCWLAEMRGNGEPIDFADLV